MLLLTVSSPKNGLGKCSAEKSIKRRRPLPVNPNGAPRTAVPIPISMRLAADVFRFCC